MIRFIKSDCLKIGPVQTFHLIWWDLKQLNYNQYERDFTKKSCSKIYYVVLLSFEKRFEKRFEEHILKVKWKEMKTLEIYQLMKEMVYRRNGLWSWPIE